MSIQIEQLIILTCYSLMGVAFYYIKIKSVRIALVVLGLILFAVNPVRFKQEGGAALERGTAQFEDIPERELAIKKEENQAIIDLTRKKNEKLLAEANYQVKMANARAIRDSNKTIGEGVTPALIELRRLEVLEKMAENKSAVFMPVEGMSSVGAQVRMYQK